MAFVIDNPLNPRIQFEYSGITVLGLYQDNKFYLRDGTNDRAIGTIELSYASGVYFGEMFESNLEGTIRIGSFSYVDSYEHAQVVLEWDIKLVCDPLKLLVRNYLSKNSI